MSKHNADKKAIALINEFAKKLKALYRDGPVPKGVRNHANKAIAPGRGRTKDPIIQKQHERIADKVLKAKLRSGKDALSNDAVKEIAKTHPKDPTRIRHIYSENKIGAISREIRRRLRAEDRAEHRAKVQAVKKWNAEYGIRPASEMPDSPKTGARIRTKYRQ